MPPRQPKPATSPLPPRTLIVDNGASTLKAGYTLPTDSHNPSTENDCHTIPNCITRSRTKRIYVGASLSQCADYGEMSFRRPMEKGYTVNWECEKEIWEQTFFDEEKAVSGLKVEDPGETAVVVTEAPNAPNALQGNIEQVLFEEFGFGGVSRCTGASLNAWNRGEDLGFGDRGGGGGGVEQLPLECLMLIDSGYSHTYVTPLYRGRLIQSAVRRLDVGGKLLTNYLKELISIRHFGLMDEPYIVNEIKEKVSFVSRDFNKDLDRVKYFGRGSKTKANSQGEGDQEGIVLDYVLPDYETNHHGFSRPHDASVAAKLSRLGATPGIPGAKKEDVFPLGNERFVPPELLFNPSDIGLKQDGLPGIIIQSLNALPEGLKAGMVANICVVGGNALIPGFVERLEEEVRSRVPAEMEVRLTRPKDPIKATWLGGARMASDPERLKKVLITREEYQEYGQAWVTRQFATRHI
ncbi:MAG: Actin- protein 6 [Bogoriella megaspora]|nr:MAG: Actin- protein 6 [Bogoriella megaspora]